MVAKTSNEYKKLLQSLLPKGRLWNRDSNSVLTQVLYGLGEELSRVEQRAEDLITESDPRNSTELLAEYELDFGIPEGEESLSDTTSERQNDVYAKFIAVGQQDKGYFIEIAAALGYAITITEHSPSWAGVVQAGESCGGQDSLFYWFVNVWYDSTIKPNITTLINYINKRKPAHTLCLFRFYDIEYDRGFSNAFDAIPWWDNSWFPYYSFSRDFDNSFTNAYDYDGVNLVGSFDHQFSLAFDSYQGGGFTFDEFGNEYRKPN